MRPSKNASPPARAPAGTPDRRTGPSFHEARAFAGRSRRRTSTSRGTTGSADRRPAASFHALRVRARRRGPSVHAVASGHDPECHGHRDRAPESLAQQGAWRARPGPRFASARARARGHEPSREADDERQERHSAPRKEPVNAMRTASRRPGTAGPRGPRDQPRRGCRAESSSRAGPDRERRTCRGTARTRFAHAATTRPGARAGRSACFESAAAVTGASSRGGRTSRGEALRVATPPPNRPCWISAAAQLPRTRARILGALELACVGAQRHEQGGDMVSIEGSEERIGVRGCGTSRSAPLDLSPWDRPGRRGVPCSRACRTSRRSTTVSPGAVYSATAGESGGEERRRVEAQAQGRAAPTT